MLTKGYPVKVEIEVDLPEHIAAEWEVIAVRNAINGDPVVGLSETVVDFDGRLHDRGPRIILRRKNNPRDWWPEFITADRIVFREDGMRLVSDNGDTGYWCYKTNLIDFSRIPKRLKRSGQTIENPWKKKVQ